MSCSSLYTAELRARGYRMTSQRLTILHILHHSGKHLAPSEIFKLAKKEMSGLTEPTVYRTLEFLAKNSLVHVSHSKSGHLTYQIAGKDHHHVVCWICGSEVEVEHKLLESLYHKLESRSGYLRINSHVTFFGVCPTCQKTEIRR